MLLSFAVRNFRCFADKAELSLVSPALKTITPRGGGGWLDATERVAAIYGPNAAGKTTFLDAIHALSTAIKSPGSQEVYQPSRVRSIGEPTDYAVDFVADGVRFRYEVSVASWGVTKESLASYPKGARRELFYREQASVDDELVFRKGKSLTGPTSETLRLTTPKMLLLATAHQYGHSTLATVANALVEYGGVTHISFRDRQDEEALKRVIAEIIADAPAQSQLSKILAQSADLGIQRIEVLDGQVSDDFAKLKDAIVFVHRGENGKEFELSLRQQSSGTLVWLTVAWHAVDALRRGSVLLVDEIDASLHPELARYLVELFINSELNARGAQLIFSTHDVSLLGNSPFKLLDPLNVWFVEKNDEGVSELYCLDEFDNRPGNNSARRYLAGQFGAIPDVKDASLIQFIADKVA